MWEFHFDPADPTPVISSILTGPRGARRVTLVFDTGAVLTQIHAPTLARIGYGEDHCVRRAVMVGAGGERHEGDLIKSEEIVALGKAIVGTIIGSFDSSELAEAGIDGLLGWDIIRQFHLEMDGPRGILKVF